MKIKILIMPFVASHDVKILCTGSYKSMKRVMEVNEYAVQYIFP